MRDLVEQGVRTHFKVLLITYLNVILTLLKIDTAGKTFVKI
jgi:hypothetical protein